jgi:hypothetical protein
MLLLELRGPCRPPTHSSVVEPTEPWLCSLLPAPPPAVFLMLFASLVGYTNNCRDLGHAQPCPTHLSPGSMPGDNYVGNSGMFRAEETLLLGHRVAPPRDIPTFSHSPLSINIFEMWAQCSVSARQGLPMATW